MGIKNLNIIIHKNASDSTVKREISHLSGKTVVIDSQMYIYKFSKQGALYEKLYLMIMIFLNNDITPIFVFDNNTVNTNKVKIEKEGSIKFNNNDKKKVRRFIESLGIRVIYPREKCEAEELCSYLVSKGEAYGCFTDDTDAFMYGCPYVFRSLNIINQTYVEYDMDKILNSLSLTLEEFQQMGVELGTDYKERSITRFHLKDTYKYYITRSEVDSEYISTILRKEGFIYFKSKSFYEDCK